MSAGTGIRHSEFNASASEPVHFLQIWVVPERSGLEPGYEQRSFARAEGALCLIGSRDGRDGSLTIHQDLNLFASLLAEGEAVEHTLAPGRSGWLQVARGAVRLGAEILAEGDGAAITAPAPVRFEALADAEVLLFDIAG